MARNSPNYNYSRTITSIPVSQRSGNRLRGSTVYSRPSAHSQSRHLRLILIGLVCLVVAVHIGWNKHVSAQATAVKQSQQVQLATATARMVVFKSQVAELQAANPLVDLGVAVATNTLGVESLGDTDAYSAASIGKLITAASYLHLVDIKQASLSQQIDGKSARYWLNLMLVKSDDVAWQNLNAYVTHAGLASYANSIGLKQYDADADNFPAIDAARLLQKLQNGSLLSPANQHLMMSWLATANYRGYIVPAVPAGSTVYHKVGFDGDNLHDAAIIERGNQRFVLVIFTNGHGNYNWDDRARLIQTIARDAQAAFL